MSGTGTVTIKGLNFRMDNEMTLPTGPTKMTSIARAEEPGVTYILNDRNKTFQKIDSKKDGPGGDPEKWTVKRLGKETIAGRTTEHVQVQQDDSPRRWRCGSTRSWSRRPTWPRPSPRGRATAGGRRWRRQGWPAFP